MRVKSVTEFQNKLNELSQDVTRKNKVIDSNLNIVTKYGFYWILLSLMRPFYAAFCKDAYSHFRANAVAQGVFKFCQINREFLTPDHIKTIEKDILGKLDDKTKKKYAQSIQKRQQKIKNLYLNPPKRREISSIDESGTSEWKWPVKIEDIGLTQT
jgi:hypothetical protein